MAVCRVQEGMPCACVHVCGRGRQGRHVVGTGTQEAEGGCHHPPSSPGPLCVSAECVLVVSGGQGPCLLLLGFPEPA